MHEKRQKFENFILFDFFWVNQFKAFFCYKQFSDLREGYWTTNFSLFTSLKILVHDVEKIVKPAKFLIFFHFQCCFFLKDYWTTISWLVDCFYHSKPRSLSNTWQKLHETLKVRTFEIFVIFGYFFGLWGRLKKSTLKISTRHIAWN